MTMGVEGTERRVLGSEPGAGNLEGTAAMHTSDDRGARLGDEYSTGESPSHGTGPAGPPAGCPAGPVPCEGDSPVEYSSPSLAPLSSLVCIAAVPSRFPAPGSETRILRSVPSTPIVIRERQGCPRVTCEPPGDDPTRRCHRHCSACRRGTHLAANGA